MITESRNKTKGWTTYEFLYTLHHNDTNKMTPPLLWIICRFLAKSINFWKNFWGQLTPLWRTCKHSWITFKKILATPKSTWHLSRATLFSCFTGLFFYFFLDYNNIVPSWRQYFTWAVDWSETQPHSYKNCTRFSYH